MDGAARPILRGLAKGPAGLIDLQQGPDGALYFLNYACRGAWNTSDSCTGLYRIEYRGACRDPGLKAETPSRLRGAVAHDAGPRVTLSAGRVSVSADGGFSLALYAVDGSRVRGFSSEGHRVFGIGSLLAGARPGMYWLQVRDGNGLYRDRIAYLP